MKLHLKRLYKTPNSTISELSVDGKFECYVLEDIERVVKIANKTAIPVGTYDVIINFSNRFQQMMPLLVDVPNYAGVRVHWGNTAVDTDGCLIVGQTKSVDFVGKSRLAYAALMKKLNAGKDIKITIE